MTTVSQQKGSINSVQEHREVKKKFTDVMESKEAKEFHKFISINRRIYNCK